MKDLRTIFLVLLSVVVCCSCSPEPVFRLEAINGNSTWYQGVEYVQSTRQDVVVTTAYYRHIDDYAILDVEVANYSDSVLWVDPASFRYTAYKSKSGSEYYIAGGMAMDPEVQILEIDKAISRERAGERTARFWDVMDVTVSLAEAIVDTEETEGERVRESQEREERAVERAVRKQEHKYEMNSLQSHRQIWELDALRKTDLFPDEYIRGQVYLPLVQDATSIEVEIPAGETLHTFRYRQHKFKP